jgi:hypothetical protein
MLVAMNVADRALEVSYRASYHITTTVPVTGSTVTVGMNWDRFPSLKLSSSESSFTWTGWLQVAPPSSEETRKMSVFVPLPPVYAR